MNRRIRVLAMTAMIVATLSVGTAGADHGGDDLVVSGEIIGPTPLMLDPCKPAMVLEAAQGVTQFIVEIPQATWGHTFTIAGDDVLNDDMMPDTLDYDVDMWFFAKSGATCKILQSPLGSGPVTHGATHGVVVLSGADGHFTLTIDNS